ncbi:MAG TPA: xanthine dehydrogenase family protein molybdopterin-binding subunit [Hypericibacter adhaerens]|jgi:carbon-monoxide dehydrogenase large subunit|uniref:Dehydrogenase/oxidase n=1 Tax=Hypericibacter adhaerens TaxID=2602016 RepID=A0A5J6MWN7_9PROT|nr:xanthine dehydrogenase family protein molybdopterin-binding subunit [Hypericibacter adhaerens]QEX21115.1 dehydrogenase/oxidase [Hypericibacter adhaerens]HWA44156.1 xanthine dehydrogenase family protein molybdopterin-binding subunit [Hypericibacter adhaerens]
MGMKAIGARVQRTEDPALLSGKGRYLDDIALPGMLHAAFLRSPLAHGVIRSIDATAALDAPGVHAVLTAQDLPEMLRNTRLPVMGSSPQQTQVMTPYALAPEEVCYVGEPVAVVVADSRYLAEDAAGLIAVDYDELPAVANCRDAAQAEAPRTHNGSSSNKATRFKATIGDAAAAFATAPHVFRQDMWQHRGCGHSIECRGAVAEHDPLRGGLTLWSSTQIPHIAKHVLCDLLAMDPESVRVIAPDVGGGFGPKAVFYPEELVVAAAAMKLGRPVKWVEDRREHFLTAVQERDQYWDVEIAVDGEGRILGVRGSMLHDGGAYLPWEFSLPYIAAVTMPGPYRLPAYDLDVTVAYTNLPPASAIRGSGRPQAVFAMERLLDRVARELGIDRAELRRRNFVQPDQMPYPTGLTYRDGRAVVYDSGDYPTTQSMALELANYADFGRRQAEARAQGRHIGIGIANYVEGCGVGPYEGVSIKVLDNGKINLRSGAAPTGQGHKTMLAQICAETLNVEIEDVIVTLGDTNAIAMGVGTFASRIAANAGPSALGAAQTVKAKILSLASRLLETPEEDLVLEKGRVEARHGNRQGLSLGELARRAKGSPGVSMHRGDTPGLEHTSYFTPAQATWCNGTHVVEVEVDIATGGVKILDYVVAHDCGTVINPLIVDGQIQGGVAHGIGNALLEWMAFDPNGQPLTTNFGEYLLPSSTVVPTVRIAHLETPSPVNPLGAKGAGEGGTIPAAAAIVSAIEHALTPFDARLNMSPLTPETIIKSLKQSPNYKAALMRACAG